MAKITKKPNRKGAPPKLEEASSNLTNAPIKQTGLTKDMNFKVDADFKKQFKVKATERGMSMVGYLKVIQEYYEINHSFR